MNVGEVGWDEFARRRRGSFAGMNMNTMGHAVDLARGGMGKHHAKWIQSLSRRASGDGKEYILGRKLPRQPAMRFTDKGHKSLRPNYKTAEPAYRMRKAAEEHAALKARPTSAGAGAAAAASVSASASASASSASVGNLGTAAAAAANAAAATGVEGPRVGPPPRSLVAADALGRPQVRVIGADRHVVVEGEHNYLLPGQNSRYHDQQRIEGAKRNHRRRFSALYGQNMNQVGHIYDQSRAGGDNSAMMKWATGLRGSHYKRPGWQRMAAAPHMTENQRRERELQQQQRRRQRRGGGGGGGGPSVGLTRSKSAPRNRRRRPASPQASTASSPGYGYTAGGRRRAPTAYRPAHDVLGRTHPPRPPALLMLLRCLS